jgi:phosphate:Na+ symporter
MPVTAVLIHLLGEITLLLWGIQMVNSGVLRAFGSDLRRILGVGLRTRMRAVLAGLGVTTILQSSTATALMVSSFSAGGAIDIAPALAVMLGANVGTTFIVQVLSFDISLVFPVLLAVGFVMFRRGRSSRMHDFGRVAIGLGLMLLSLHLLTETIRPIESLAALKSLFTAIAPDAIFHVLLAAAFAWAAHSSVAAMLFVASLAGGGIIDSQAALAMVLGANLGSALNPVFQGTGGDPARLRVPVGNLVMRTAGCLIALPLLGPILSALSWLDPNPARLTANFHTLFNVALAIVFLPVLPWCARLLQRVLPDQAKPTDPAAPQYLDASALDTPSVALSNAAREVLRMADVVDTMLRKSQNLFHEDDRNGVIEVSRMDDVVDSLYTAVHRYLGAISHDALSEADGRRLSEILAFAINLEHVGDIIDKNLMEIAAKRIKNRLRLPDNSLAEIDGMHARLLEHLRLAAAVLMFQDVASARRLVAEKEQFREIERAATRWHLAQMRAAHPEAMEASALQLDIVRDLKRMEAHIAATAYALLEHSGDLRPSRLAS